ncbi:MAG: MazG family protein [Clostridiales bacterium]|nr:MazG family protein [Clostridiales bacterium]
MSQKYSYEDLLKIMETLRSENGCPWDRVQTHESLKPCVVEEAAELVSSIRIYEQCGNAENMCEELGDLLLQVVMHAQIAGEEGLFTMEDVVQGISEKMVRRHPHVFGTGNADTPDAVVESWDEIKKKEKEGKSWIESPLREIPKEHPALTRASKVLKKAHKLYGYETEYSLEECVAGLEAELDKEEVSRESVSERLGDLLMQIADIAAQYKLSAEQILTDKVEDVIEKYEPFPGQGG